MSTKLLTVPLDDISTLIDEAMGTNAEYGAIVHFVCYPEQYGYFPAPAAAPPADKAGTFNDGIQKAAELMEELQNRAGSHHNYFGYAAKLVHALKTDPPAHIKAVTGDIPDLPDNWMVEQ